MNVHIAVSLCSILMCDLMILIVAQCAPPCDRLSLSPSARSRAHPSVCLFDLFVFVGLLVCMFVQNHESASLETSKITNFAPTALCIFVDASRKRKKLSMDLSKKAREPRNHEFAALETSKIINLTPTCAPKASYKQKSLSEGQRMPLQGARGESKID